MLSASAAPPVTAPRRMGHFEYKWIALGVVLLGTIMTILDATIVNIAVPALQSAFHVSTYNDIAWVITGYLLAQGAVIPMTGWVTDRWGTKRVYLITIALFTLASMACGVAQNLPELIVFRVLQGVGGGMIMPIGMTIIMHAVGPRQMGKVMGVFGVPMLLGPALGPVLGGWFVQDFSWRLIFYVNVPIGIVAFVLARLLLVESDRSHGLRLDGFGMLTATPAVVALMYAVDRSTELGWSSPLVVGLLAFSGLTFAAFVLSQTGRRRAAARLALGIGLGTAALASADAVRFGIGSVEALTALGAAVLVLAACAQARRNTADNLLELSLFRDPTFSWAMALTFVIVTSMFGGMLLIPLYLQQVHGWDAITTGLALLPQAAAAAIAMPLGGALTDRFGPRPVVATGVVMLAAGGVLLAQLHPDSGAGLLVGALAFRGFAMGFTMMPSNAAALARVPRRFASRASSITNTVQRVGSSVGIAILVTVLAGQFSTATQQVACAPPAQAVAASGGSESQLCGRLEGQLAKSGKGNGAAQGAIPQASDPLSTFVHGYFNNVTTVAFDRVFALIAIISIFGLIPAMFLRKPEAGDRGDVSAAAELAA